MKYLEEYRDLFSCDKSYVLVHCISSDFMLGLGIAKEFAKRGVKNELFKAHEIAIIGDALFTNSTGWKAEFNLVTKENYWSKPTYNSLRQSLISLKINLSKLNITKIAMPKIGCGLDKLEWQKVKQIIFDIFSDTDIEILVCIK